MTKYTVVVFDIFEKVNVVDNQKLTEQELNLFLYDFGKIALTDRYALINKAKADGIAILTHAPTGEKVLNFTIIKED